jgi:hypothetical protein
MIRTGGNWVLRLFTKSENFAEWSAGDKYISPRDWRKEK